VVAQLTQASAHKHTHPDDDFALCIIATSTILHRFERCFFAPCWVSTVSASSIPVSIRQDVDWPWVSDSTLRQFLDSLSAWTRRVLDACAVADRAGPIIYVDGT